MSIFFNRYWLENNMSLKITAYYYKRWDYFDMPAHAHQAAEIMYVLEGRCTVETAGIRNVLKKGEFILLESMLEHSLLIEKNESCRMLNIEFTFHQKDESAVEISSVLKKSNYFLELIDADTNFILLRDSDEIYMTLKNMIIELDRKKADNTFLLSLLFCELMERVAALYYEKSDIMSNSSNIYVKEAQIYIQSHYDCDLKAEDIASQVNLHPVYLQRVFKKHTGITISDYIAKIRMEKAAMLLKNTGIQIIDISAYVGIGSRQYFSYIFKKTMGMSPAEYRKSTVKKTNNETKLKKV
jgi:YesN/AraC family two-component response regulator